MSDTQPLDNEELREQLAAIEHERWADWQRYCNQVLRARATDERTLEERLQHWDRQINTPYSLLTKKEQASDMEQVDRYWHLITTQKEAWENAHKIDGNTSDGYHTFNELYDYRRVYNAALFNEWSAQGKYDVHKSWKHSDGEDCFGGGWFIVMAELPTGQVSNHYEAEYWDGFSITAKDKANEYDGHTPQQALDRINELKTKGENNGNLQTLRTTILCN